MRAHIYLDAATRQRVERFTNFYGDVSLSSLVRRALALLDTRLRSIADDPASQVIERSQFAESHLMRSRPQHGEPK